MREKFLSENRKGRDYTGRPRRRWKDNIRMDLMEIEWKVMDWIQLAQNRDQWQGLMSTITKHRIS
jgi:hypothetical protein